MRLEQTILKNLIYNEDYTRKVLPFIKAEYFSDNTDATLFKRIHEFIETYNSPPTVEAIDLAIQEGRNISADELERLKSNLQEITSTPFEGSELQWLVDRTEKFCQERAVYIAVLDAIRILDGKDKVSEKGAIPSILSEALAVSFDNSVGHDYLENSDRKSTRLNSSHIPLSRMPSSA